MSERPVASEPISFPIARSNVFDPTDELRPLREEQPLCPLRFTNGDVGWLVTNHPLAKAVLTDSRFGSCNDIQAVRRRGLLDFGDNGERVAEFQKALEPFEGWTPLRGFILMDPPEHTWYRRMLAPHFTTRRIAEYRSQVERIVAARLDAMADAGAPIDFVSTFAAPVSLWSQCTLLGIPADEAQRFYYIGHQLTDRTIPAAEAVGAWREAWEYVRALSRQRRQKPIDDVISAIAARNELSDEEVADTVLVLFQAGLDTTGDMIAFGLFILLCHPDQLDALRNDPSMVGSAVEELLRYGGFFHTATRNALEDIELDGTSIKAGETVVVSLPAANRDPAKFDEPDNLDLRRSATGHLAFAQGGHMCAGQHLARLELQVSLTALNSRFPTLRLAVPQDQVPVYGPRYLNPGVHELPVTW
jgi:cytochrome P450